MNILMGYLSSFWFIWLPWILGFIFLKSWRAYVNENFLEKKVRTNYTLLEIHIPKEVFKSPEAMEIIIDILWFNGGGAMDWKQRLINGASLIPASLEIVSIEGSIYFFIRVNSKIAHIVKNALYSQYPEVEVHEVEDYVSHVPNYNENENSWSLYGAEFTLAKEDFIPIKTYIDYGLDTNLGSLEEQQKIDPISPLLEYLGSLGKGENMWIQYIIRSDVFNDWRKEAQSVIEDIMGRAKPVIDDEAFQSVKLTHGEQETIKGIERTLHKHTFEVKIRALYLAPKDLFIKNNTNILKNGVFKPFSSQYFNGIKKDIDSGLVDWKYEDITGKRTQELNKRFFNDYIEREAFDEPFSKYLNFLWYKRKKPIVLSSEELATLFHIPGRVSSTTSIDRIDAVKAEAPANLPI